MPPESPKTDDLIARLTRDLAPTRPGPTPLKVAMSWTVMALILSGGLVLIQSGARPDLAAALATPRLGLGLALTAALAAAAAYLAASLALPGRPLPLASRRAPWILLALLAGTLASYGFGHDVDVGAGLDPAGARCTLLLCLGAALPGGGLFMAMQRFAPLRPAGTGLAVGLAAAAAGGFGLALHCPSDNPMHLLVYHALPVGLVAALAGMAGARWLRW